MSDECSTPGSRQLSFFGTAMAVVSHDLKNMLSIIGESAGLLQDLMAMSRSTGRLPDLEKLDSIAARIQKNTARADSIVRRMNTFAHSADELLQSFDLTEAARLVAKMGERRWNRTAVTATVAEGTPALIVEGGMFEVLRATWMCLEAACGHAGPERRITIHVESSGGRPSVRFSGLEPLGDEVAEDGTTHTRRELEAVVSTLPSGMDLFHEEKSLTLRMPAVAGPPPAVDAEERGN